MKHIRLIYSLLALVSILAWSMISSGCSRLHEDMQPCPWGIRLKVYYDYNMKFADALPAEVKHVSVYTFDPVTGHLLDQVNVPVGNVREHEFDVNLDHLPPGRYSFLIWCYGESSEFFTVNPTRAETPLHKQHSCLIRQEDDRPGHQSNDIGSLYHGQLENIDCTAENTVYTLEAPLVKNTNTVRLVLQHLSGEFLDPAKFDITIESDNGHMDHDNTLIEDNFRVYHPWAIESGMTGMGQPEGDATRTITSVSALVAEMTIGRIIPETGVRLRVRNVENGEEIINIPFVDYALLVKGNYNRPMSDQEYLDRQDEYNLVFFLDNNLRWMNQYIYINSWRIVLQNTDL